MLNWFARLHIQDQRQKCLQNASPLEKQKITEESTQHPTIPTGKEDRRLQISCRNECLTVVNCASSTKYLPFKHASTIKMQRQIFTSSAEQSKTVRQISPMNTRSNAFGNASCRLQRDVGHQHHSSLPQSSSGHMVAWSNELDISAKTQGTTLKLNSAHV